jgi:ABC-2 type transport system permease protein
MAFALAFNFYIQSATSRMEDSSWVLASFAGPDALLARIGQAYPPAFLAWKSMTVISLVGPLCALANLVLGLGAASLVALALGKAYAKSLLGFDEQRIKRIKATRGFIARSFRQRPALFSLFLRELRLMNREPVYFMNGPFIIVLMPLILVVSVLVMSQNHNAMRDLGPFLASWKTAPWAMLASAAFGAFLGSSTSITCTALSRDAKALRYLKALPLNYRDFMLAKFLHGLVFAFFGALVGGLGCALAFGLGPLDATGAFFIALAFSSFACAAGLWLDTANPRLGWDSPTAALKQNPNAMIFILGVMSLIAALGVASAFIPLGKLGFFALYFGAFGAAAIAILFTYPKYAQRVIENIEV